ncbi:MAG TPA: hypothetical protein VFB17_00790 [Gaiellaceae bacterium]|nr:hypothetical protein [Gaiellaceae bacterium]
MRRGAVAAAVAVCAVLALAAAAAGGRVQPLQPVQFGVADDTGKYANDDGVSFFGQIASLGLHVDRMTVLWDPSRPLTITDASFLDRSIPTAVSHGVDVRLAVRPATARAIGTSAVRARAFAAFVALLAKRYPQVKTFVIGNEPNQPRFWQPQFSRGKAVAAIGYEKLLADSYDALKAVDPSITVVGGVLSSRGNDAPHATSNASRSPIRFIADLGAAYRKSKRTNPLMDQFGFHPYPRSDRDSLARGFDWPDAGFANLARVKQALWDAFRGTAQPTVESGLSISIDEIGWQTSLPAASLSSYTGSETVPVTTDAAQAAIYSQLIARSVCDSSISSVLFAPFVDETQLSGFQSGLERADGTKRPSYDAVKAALATEPRCTGKPVAWRHATSVLGARALFGSMKKAHWWKQRVWSFGVRVGEDATYRAAIVRAPGRGVLSARQALRARPTLRTRGYAKAAWTPRVRFPLRRLAPGRYAYVVDLRAAVAPSRTRVLVSHTFVVR